MKVRDYMKELSLTILGVLIALLIDNYREDIRDEKIVRSYLDIVAEDLNFDIQNLSRQLKFDSAHTSRLKILSDVLTTNPDLPQLNFGLAAWTKQDSVRYRKLSDWDSLDYYTLQLYSNSEYKTRKIGFSTITNSNLSHKIEEGLLKKITIYYTTDSDNLDLRVAVDEKCHWNAIPWLNRYQGNFKEVILKNDFNTTLLRNEASGRYGTILREMESKRVLIEKAKDLLVSIQAI